MSKATVETLIRLFGLYLIVSTTIETVGGFATFMSRGDGLFRDESLLFTLFAGAIVKVLGGVFVLLQSGALTTRACQLSPATKRAMSQDD